MRTGDLAPDHSDLGAPDGTLGPVDIGHALSAVPLCRFCAVDALKLEERGSRVGIALSREALVLALQFMAWLYVPPLVGDVLAPR